HGDLDVDEVVAAWGGLARRLRDAAAADAEHLPGLRALGDPHVDRPVERDDLEHGAERGLREADRVLAAHVEAVAPEHGVLGDPQVDVEVAGRGAALAGLALALEGLDAAVLGAGGHDDGELAGPAVAVGDVDRLAAAERGILEAELERVAQVAAALPAAAPAEQVV